MVCYHPSVRKPPGSQKTPGEARNLKALNDIYILGCLKCLRCIVDHLKFAKQTQFICIRELVLNEPSLVKINVLFISVFGCHHHRHFNWTFMSGSQVVDFTPIIWSIYYSACTSALSAPDQTNFTPGGKERCKWFLTPPSFKRDTERLKSQGCAAESCRLF